MAVIDRSPLPWLWCVAAAVLAAMVYVYADRAKRKLPPGPWGWPIVGSLLQLGPNPHQTFTRMAAKYGPLMSVRLGTQLAVVASSPAMAEQVLKKHDHVLGGRIVSDAATSNKYWGYSMLVMQLGPQFRNYRKIANTHLFSAKKLDSLQHLRAQQLDRTMRHVLETATAGAEVEVRRTAFACTVNLMATTIFGAQIFDHQSSELAAFQAAVIDVMHAIGMPNVSDFLPFLRPLDLQGVRREAKAAFARLHVTLDRLLQERVAEPPEQAAQPRDLLAGLLESRSADFGVQDVAGFITGMFVAGTDTVTVSTEWAMAELMRNPEMMAKCQAEMDGAVGRERRVTEGDAERLPNLNAVIKETYRLHPPGPLMIPHRAMEEVEVAGYTVPENSRVLVNMWAITRDPKIYENPETFDPERFLRRPELDYRGQQFEYFPFGSGRRMCLGMPLGSRMVFLLVASLVQGFDWSLPGVMRPQDVDMTERFSIALGKDVPLHILPSPRLAPHLYDQD